METQSVVEMKPHTHLPYQEKEVVAQLMAKLEDRVKDTSDPIPGLFDECLIEARQLNVEAFMPSFDSVRSTLYARRKEIIPVHSGDAMTVQINERWAKTLNNEPFLLVDRTYMNQGATKRLLVFLQLRISRCYQDVPHGCGWNVQDLSFMFCTILQCAWSL